MQLKIQLLQFKLKIMPLSNERKLNAENRENLNILLENIILDYLTTTKFQIIRQEHRYKLQYQYYN